MPVFGRIEIHMKKFLIIFLSFMLALGGLASCDRPEPADEGEVRAAAVSLLEAAVEVNRVFFGEGLPMGERVAPTVDMGYGEYVALDEEHKYMTRDDIMNIARAVYTEQYCDSLETIVFDGAAIDDDDFVAPRYSEEGGVMKICYLMTTEGLPERVPLTDTLRTVEIKSKSATLEVDTVCEGKTETVTFTVKLEASGWRLDTPTY